MRERTERDYLGWLEHEDGLVPFGDILSQISKARDEKPAVPSKPPKSNCPKTGPSLRTVSFKPTDAVGRAFTPRIGILKPREMNVWDVERAFAPQRTWPCKGAQCEFYDYDRVDKPEFVPVAWSHTGDSFGPRPGFISQPYHPESEYLDKSSSQPGAASPVRRPASAHSSKSSRGSAPPPASMRRPQSAMKGARPASAGRGYGAVSQAAARAGSPVRSTAGQCPGLAQEARRTSIEEGAPVPDGVPRPASPRNQRTGTPSGRASRPASARSGGRPSSARSSGRPSSATSRPRSDSKSSAFRASRSGSKVERPSFSGAADVVLTPM